MTTFLQFHASDDANGRMLIANWTGSGSGRMIAHAALLNSTVFKAPIETLYDRATHFAAVARREIGSLNENGWRQHSPAEVTSTFGQSFRHSIKAGLDRRAELDGIRSDWLLRKIDPAQAAETRAWLRTCKVGEATSAALANPDVAAAALQLWHLSGLPDGLRPQVESQLILANLTDRYGAQHHRIKPNVTDPLPHGIDSDKALSAAKAAIAAHEASRAEIDLVRSTLTSAVDFTAVAAGLSANSAFDLLNRTAA